MLARPTMMFCFRSSDWNVSRLVAQDEEPVQSGRVKPIKSSQATPSQAIKSSHVKSSQAMPSQAKSRQANAKSSQVKSSHAKSSQAKTSQAKSSQAKPRQVKPRHAKCWLGCELRGKGGGGTEKCSVLCAIRSACAWLRVEMCLPMLKL